MLGEVCRIKGMGLVSTGIMCWSPGSTSWNLVNSNFLLMHIPWEAAKIAQVIGFWCSPCRKSVLNSQFLDLACTRNSAGIREPTRRWECLLSLFYLKLKKKMKNNNKEQRQCPSSFCSPHSRPWIFDWEESGPLHLVTTLFLQFREISTSPSSLEWLRTYLHHSSFLLYLRDLSGTNGTILWFSKNAGGKV